MDLKSKISEAKQMASDLAVEADALENKHLRDILRDAAGRLQDAENHPDAAGKSQPSLPFPGAQTGEPNPMTD